MSGKASGRTRLAEHPGVFADKDSKPAERLNGGAYRAAQRWAAACKVPNEDRWFVCLRAGVWYALGPRMSEGARGNPAWPDERGSAALSRKAQPREAATT